ncbi:hypothetical protein LC612_41995, partial [Nostoc sp. CHAB 5834]|nr:hypothetical protein [Nostoc sp. CHAB 5834]
MSSLIITILSVLLVSTLALAALVYTGSASNQASAKAEAAKYLNQGQQLLGAADLFKSDKGEWPLSIEQLRTSNYLSSEVLGVNGTKWTMPIKGNPTFVLADVARDSCKQVNNLAFKVEGVFSKLSSSYSAQCFSPEPTSYSVVVTKGASQLTQTGECPAGTTVEGLTGLGQVICKPLPDEDCDSPDWRVKSKDCGGPPVNPPPSPKGVQFNPPLLSYVFDKGQSSTSTTVTLKNKGPGSVSPSDIIVNDPNYSFYILPDCN